MRDYPTLAAYNVLFRLHPVPPVSVVRQQSGDERRLEPAAPKPEQAAAHGAPGKLAELDGLRGVASLIVVAWHFALAFAPRHVGVEPPFESADGLVGSPLLALIGGPGAVILFFVLSGYVLPLAWFRSGRIEVILRAAAKRWFRLVGLTLLAAISSYLLFHFGLYHYREAAFFTHSHWLGDFGGGDHSGQLRPSLVGAVLEGGVFAFLRNSDVYDPVMWSMRDELFGSLMTFGLAAIVWRCRVSVGVALLAAAAVATQWVEPRLLAFIAGLALSWMHARGVRPPSRWRAVVCLVAGALLFGYLEPRGFYAPMAVLHQDAGVRTDQVWVQTVSGVLLILGLLGSGRVARLLASTGGRLLGRLSFPMYLLHFPLLCSLTCWLFLTARTSMTDNAALALAAAGSLPVLALVSYLFAQADEAWLARINAIARHVIPSRSHSAAQDRVGQLFQQTPRRSASSRFGLT